jgi:nicotinate-nucleotide adenylyltransferase
MNVGDGEPDTANKLSILGLPRPVRASRTAAAVVCARRLSPQPATTAAESAGLAYARGLVSSNVAVFGGSYNPPHVGHVLACALLAAVEEVDRILVVPTFRHPFAKALAPFEDRLRMCELAMGELARVTVSRVEEEIGGESRTLRTLEHLHAAHPDWRLRLVIGADILTEAPRWFGFESIVKLAPPIVLARAGVEAPGQGPPLLPRVSSTQVREALGRGDFETARHFVPRAVLAHIRARGLYATGGGP